MSTIPFIQARLFDPDETARSLEIRFQKFLRKLRTPGALPDASDSAAGVATSDDPDDWLPPESDQQPMLTAADLERIRRRAGRIIELRKQRSGLAHLRKEEQERLAVLRNGVKLIRIPSPQRADEIAAAIHAEMPWMGPATDLLWRGMRRSVSEGHPGFRMPPVLLDGPPGIGKSHWARRVGVHLGVPVTVVEATTENASFAVVGSQRGWSGAYPGRLLQTVLDSLIGNPLMIVDEIEKAGRPTSSSGIAFGLSQALLPLIEPLTARSWSCPYYQMKFDMSWIGWVLTSNSLGPLPRPLLSRLTVLKLPELTIEQLAGFAMTAGQARGLSEASLSAIAEALQSVTRRAERRPSIRTVMRMLDRAADLENKPPLM